MPDPDPHLALEKAALRRRMRTLRRAIALEEAEAAAQAAVLAAVAFLPNWRGRIVAGYIRMGSEFDPDPLLAAAQAAGALIALPGPAVPGAALTFHTRGADPAGGEDGSPVRAPVRPDVILTPLLAFDARGGRLGQGGGHFDRTLAALRAPDPAGAPPPLVVGVAFAVQEVAAAPMAAHDQRLDAILTERGYREVRKDVTV